MCGIAGIFLRQRAVAAAHLDALARRIAHRGPDKVKLHVDGAVGLAHARLSIIDIDGGDQPLFAAEGRLALIANGEIYNYIELRRDLEARGAHFATQSDCEAILHAYLHYGDGFLDRLNGMFAFALYDRQEQKLLLARDRLGIKPLFYAETEDGVYFASEQKALLQVLPGPLAVAPDALVQILETGFNTGATTVVAGLRRLAPGHLAVCRQGRLVSTGCYWSPLRLAAAETTYEQAAAEFESLLAQVMKEHVRSDVPFALFLSGGVDSSVVLEGLRRQGVEHLQAFTAAFAGAPNQDDLEAAVTIARRFGLQHSVIELRPQDLFAHLPFAIWAADDFILDDAILPTSLLAREVSRDFKVVFSGEGGDELFAGYGRYRRSRLQRFLANLRAPGSGGFRTRGMLGPAWRNSLLEETLREQLPAARRGFVQAWASAPGGWSDLQRMQFTDMATELTDQLLVKVDRMLMAWGLEGRVPLLDHRLVEFALRLPDTLKLRAREGKYFLKQWAEPLFGRELVRRPKRGFSVPVKQCLDAPTVSRLGRTLPGHPAFAGLFKPAGVAAVVRRQASHGDATRTLWALLQFAVWHRIFIVGDGEKPAPFADPVDFISH